MNIEVDIPTYTLAFSFEGDYGRKMTFLHYKQHTGFKYNLYIYYHYTEGTLMDPMSSTLGNISPNRALIFKGTKSSARVTPTLTIAVAAPAS